MHSSNECAYKCSLWSISICMANGHDKTARRVANKDTTNMLCYAYIYAQHHQSQKRCGKRKRTIRILLTRNKY